MLEALTRNAGLRHFVTSGKLARSIERGGWKLLSVGLPHENASSEEDTLRLSC
jgi:hypothetical protein